MDPVNAGVKSYGFKLTTLMEFLIMGLALMEVS
jgi:hypothetical protein